MIMQCYANQYNVDAIQNDSWLIFNKTKALPHCIQYCMQNSIQSSQLYKQSVLILKTNWSRVCTRIMYVFWKVKEIFSLSYERHAYIVHRDEQKQRQTDRWMDVL